MGNSIAPKTFPSATPFGASPQTPVTTEVQPQAQVQGPGTPDSSAYTKQMADNTPGAAQSMTDSIGGFGDVEALRRRIQDSMNMGGGRPMPFFG